MLASTYGRATSSSPGAVVGAAPRYYLGDIPGVKLAHMKGVGIAESWPAARLRRGWSPPAAPPRRVGAQLDVRLPPVCWPARWKAFASTTRDRAADFLTQTQYPRSRSNAPSPPPSAIAASRSTSARRTNCFSAMAGRTRGRGGAGDLSLGGGAEGDSVSFRAPHRGSVIRLNVYPILQQTMSVSLNGHSSRRSLSGAEWRDYDIPLPAFLGARGSNRVTFSFSNSDCLRPTRPRRAGGALVPGGHHHRRIGQSPKTPRSRRSASTSSSTAESLWRDTPTRFPAARLRREGVEPLPRRLGYDPRLAWPGHTRRGATWTTSSRPSPPAATAKTVATFSAPARSPRTAASARPNDIEEHDLLRRLGSVRRACRSLDGS